ncbi:hypothetical protein Pla52o_10850 [Novipirellula galeiformis]|uniref:Uncharacterized protein n=1 Tax=Novipirellula galeiformis TaxID=2528004 RepID=A0A5C6CUX3_9BACT|nr:hypothetical protein Pla52o_10850 [Novipirellula galeiformis]
MPTSSAQENEGVEQTEHILASKFVLGEVD